VRTRVAREFRLVRWLERRRDRLDVSRRHDPRPRGAASAVPDNARHRDDSPLTLRRSTSSRGH
jgi:hypothetical protein